MMILIDGIDNIISANGKKFPYTKSSKFNVQVGHGNKGSYSTKYSFE